MPSSETTLARVELARRHEELVLAEASLEGERVLSWARLGLVVLLTASQLLRRIDGAQHPDALRGLGALLYWLFTLGTIVALRRARPDPRRAQGAFWLTCVDAAFFWWMAFRSSVLVHRGVGQFEPEMLAAGFAVPVMFTISRFSNWQVAAAAALSSAGYLSLAWKLPDASPHAMAFVVATYVVLAIVVAIASARVRNLFSKLRRRDNLARFLAPQVVEQVMRFGEAALAPTQREATLLFSDLRDFTTLSEKMEPRALLELLDGYFTDMTRIVKGCDGIVNKFIGDGMLAVWGVPERQPNHAQLAMKAALAMRARVAEINAVREREGLPPLRIGIGIHTGTVAAGMLGGADQHEYTVIGDAVNVASRIEGLNKEHRTDILVSEAAWAHAGSRFEGALVGESTVKGRQVPVRVYALRAAAAGPVSALSDGELAGIGS